MSTVNDEGNDKELDPSFNQEGFHSLNEEEFAVRSNILKKEKIYCAANGSTANGSANGHSNGAANGHADGISNGHANGKAKTQ